MGLKQDIVFKSRFSVPSSPGHGSRGGTPGEFILRYMSRQDAIENIMPTRVSEAEEALHRFDVREASSREEHDVPSIRHRIRKSQKKGGVAFTNDDPSVSDAKLKVLSKDIQEHFDRGHTVLEAVISFTDEYLKDNGVLDPDLVFERRGDFAGHVDQLKLRKAIMNGMEKVGRNFDDLRYVGVIQVDTAKVHCHVVMVDYGYGRRASDGTQKGKLSSKELMTIRRGIDSYLDDKQTVKMMSSSVMHDKRNALCYIKRYTHKTMAQQGLPQFLLACLPDNRNYWAANSNRQEMRKANAIVREFVTDILQPVGQQPTPMYRKAHQSIVDYADGRKSREGISDDEYMKLIRDGEERLIRDCMNGVYAVLKQIPKERMVVRTPMLEAMSMDYESMAAQVSRAVQDPMMEFGFKLRSYASRLDYHKREYHRFKQEYEDYENTPDKSEESKALGDHLALERDYQMMLMVKYQHFLTFLPPDDEIEDDFDALMKQQERLVKMRQMENDPSFKRMGNIAADNYGMSVYGIHRGSMIKSLPRVWERRLENEQLKYDTMLAEFKDKLLDAGLSFDGHGVTKDKAFPFDDVKALDLHHLGYDFPTDIPISKRNIDRFVEVAQRRYDSFLGAKEYLERTGQSAGVSALLDHDVMIMKQMADKFSSGDYRLTSVRPNEGLAHDGSTIRLTERGVDYTTSMRDAVRSTVEATRVFE